jgi:hypothetical protein
LILAELRDFRPDQGIIRLHEQRVVILSAAAMGLMRKQLVDTLGLETARRVLLRFGFADGYHDAVKAAEALNISTVTLWRKMKQFGLRPDTRKCAVRNTRSLARFAAHSGPLRVRAVSR